jgi:hypothetical protein
MKIYFDGRMKGSLDDSAELGINLFPLFSIDNFHKLNLGG